MKKITLIIVLLIISLIIINQKIVTSFIEKIDLNLQEDEIAVVFLSSDNYKSILVKDNDFNYLIVLEFNKSINELKNNLNKFVNSSINYLFIDDSLVTKMKINYEAKHNLDEKLNINNLMIEKNDNIIILSNPKLNLCIYDVGKNNNLDNCDFVYFLNIEYKININEKLKAIFYEKDVLNKFKEETYIKWIDNYEITSDSYNILRISNDSYDIITIPIENDIQNF